MVLTISTIINLSNETYLGEIAMIEKEYNFKYCGFNIIVRNSKGRAKLNDQVCFDIKGKNHDEIKAELELLVNEYLFNKCSSLRMDRLVLLGLSQISSDFANNILQQLKQYSNKWSQETKVCFGITGVISEGKAGSPNYQLESIDGKNKKAFYFNGEPYDVAAFEENHITQPLSQKEVSQIWNLVK